MKALLYFLLRWLCGWGDLLQGICEVLSLGYWNPAFSLYTDNWFLNYCERYGFDGN